MSCIFSSFADVYYGVPFSSKGKEKMKKHTLIAVLLASLALLLSSCQTVVSIPYTRPSNIDMSSYRNVAVVSASAQYEYKPVDYTVRYSYRDPRTVYYAFESLVDDYSAGKTAASVLTKRVSKIFNSSSYYSTYSTEKVDSYRYLYGNRLTILKEEGIDALIVPRITSMNLDEYIDARIVKDYRGIEKSEYTLYRKVSLTFSLIVLDTATGRIVAETSYSTSCKDWVSFDPAYYYYGGISSISSIQDLIDAAVYNKTSEIVADFIPTREYADVTLKDNDPKLSSVEDAYKAAENGNLDYALTLFRNAYETQSHVPSGYNAALIIAAGGDIDSALSILSDIRSRGLDDREVNYLYSRLLNIKAKNEEAKKQYEPKEDTLTYISSDSYLL